MLTAQPHSDGGAVPILRPRPRPARFGAGWSVVLVALDLVAAAAGAYLAQGVTRGTLAPIGDTFEGIQTVAFAVLLWLLVFERIGMYRRSFSLNARDEIYASLAASMLSVMPAIAVFALAPTVRPERSTLIVATFLAAGLVSVIRFAAHAARRWLFPRPARRIAVVGAPDRVRAVPSDLSLFDNDYVVRVPIDSFDDDLTTALAEGKVSEIPWLRTAIDRECDEVIITEALPPNLMPELLRVTETLGIKLAFAPMRIRPYACDFSIRRDGGLALLYPRRLTICTPGADVARRVFDLAMTLPLVVAISPVLALIALAVYLDNGAPVLYRQLRVGRGGKTFEILKFRTMTVDAESSSGPVWARTGEARTTRVGRLLRRTSLDELPQFFNVLRGDMSLVGPRPERPFYVEQFKKMLPRYEERHLVRPGITGWSHIHMKRNVDTSAIGERLSYDLFYLEHWSLFMDILILCKTAAEFLFHSAA